MINPTPDPAATPEALRVIKRQIPVEVRFAAADGVCQTLEGPVRYRAGDALITGGRGEQWPITRATFDISYYPASDSPGYYIKRPLEAYALLLQEPVQVPVGWQDDPLQGNPGNWLLRYADGSQGVVEDSIFRETYGPAAGETRWPPP